MNSLKISNFKLKIIFGLLGYLLIGLFPQQTHADEQTLRVSPVIINVSLSPDKTYTHEVTIENLTDTPMPLRASLNDFMTEGEEGGYVFEETRDNPLLQWITLSESEFLLNPKEKKTIQMTIHTPKSIPLGGYYGILFFEPVVQEAVLNATRINSKVGILMLANVGVPDPNAAQAEIVNFSTDLLSGDGTVPLMLRVKNISLNFFTAKPIITISPLLPISPSSPPQITLQDKIIFPGKIRRWTENTTIKNLTPNIYKAHMAVSTGNGKYVHKENYIIVFPYVHALGGMAVVIVILFFIVKRKRLKEAAGALFK